MSLTCKFKSDWNSTDYFLHSNKKV